MNDTWNIILTFIKDHYIVTGVFITSLVQISPIKINPLTWVVNLLKRMLKWISKCMMSEVMEKFNDIEKRFDEVSQRFDCIEEETKATKKESDEIRIKDIRWNLLNFADTMSSTDYEKDAYEHMLYELHPEYNILLERNGLTNGRVDNAIRKMEMKYNKLFNGEDEN